MLNKYLVTLAASLALIVAIAIASVGMRNNLVAWDTSAGQAIACSGHAGGGC